MQASRHHKIYNVMVNQIKCDLTNGRSDEDLIPYTDAEAAKFIKDHESQIMCAVIEMYNAYENELDELDTAEADWYREFLYLHVASYPQEN